MTTYRLIVSTEVFETLDRYLDYIAVEKQSPLNAERWLQKAWKELRSLRKLPHRYPLAPENANFSFEVRMKIVGTQFFLYHIDEPNKVVRVFAFRGASQLPR